MKKKLLLIVPMLHQGGFERVCIRTARMLAEECDVSILIFNDEDIAFDIEGLDIINIDIKSREGRIRKLWNVFQRIHAVKRIKKERKIDISYSFGVTANLVNVFAKAQDKRWVGLRGYTDLYSRTLQTICSRADKIVCCSKVIEAAIKERFAGKEVVNIPNSYDIEFINAQAGEEIQQEDRYLYEEGYRVLVAVGREDDLKGYWHLIRSFARVVQTVHDVRLLIIGEGEYLEDKKFAADLGIKDKVFFTGVRRNPFPYVKRACVYILSSRNEGFPNALVEAMALEKPVMATNCQSGPAEILFDDYRKAADDTIAYDADYGVLLPMVIWNKDLHLEGLDDAEVIMADEIIKMLADENKQKRYAALARKRAEQFSDEMYKAELLSNIMEPLQKQILTKEKENK